MAAAAGGLPGDRAAAHSAQRALPHDPDGGHHLAVRLGLDHTGAVRDDNNGVLGVYARIFYALG